MNGGGWPVLATTPLLLAGGAGHAFGFSPLASRLAAAVRPAQAADQQETLTWLPFAKRS